jgi:hypothetical protein
MFDIILDDKLVSETLNFSIKMNGGTVEKWEKDNEITIFDILLEFRQINC